MRQTGVRVLLVLVGLALPLALAAKISKEPVIRTRDKTVMVDRSKLRTASAERPVDIEEISDKTGTSLSIRPEGGFGYLIRVDRLKIGKHAMAPSAPAIDRAYLSGVLTQLRTITYRQKGIKLLGTEREEMVDIDGRAGLLAVDKMSIETREMYAPEHYRGFLIFASGSSVVIAHFEFTGILRESPAPLYIAELESIFRATTIVDSP